MANFSKAEAAKITKKAKELEYTNPQTAIDAFVQKKYKIGGLDTIPLTIAHYVILEKIKSPFTKTNIGDFANIASEQYMDMAFVITHSAAESRELLAEGEEAFKEAVFKFCEKIEIKDMKEVGYAIGLTLLQASSTSLKTEKKTQKQMKNLGR